MTEIGERKACITGVGKSQCGRRLRRDPWSLTAAAALAAIADAGLEAGDIDGVSSYPGAVGSTPGITGAGCYDVRNLLGLKLRWFTAGMEVCGQLGSIVNAAMAVACGLVNHVLCFRTVWESSAQDAAGGRSQTVQNNLNRELYQWFEPYGFGNSCYGAMTMQRYMHESGASREQLGQIAVNARRNAADNDSAIYRTPMSIDDYLSSKMISTPLCLLDCDVPIDGSVAVVVSRADHAAINRKTAISIQAAGTATGFEAAADMMWSRTDLKPKDVRVAQLYDGFSILTIKWMEALRLVPSLEAGRFIEGGKRIARDGELPLNTGGGQLSGGRMHGYGGLHEACIQLRALGGARQVTPRPDVAVVTSGAADFTSALLLAL
jgi:acetyl-CoA acetyltransferase